MKGIEKEVGAWDLQVYKLWNESDGLEDFADKLLAMTVSNAQKEINDLTLALYYFTKGVKAPELKLPITQKETIELFAQLWREADFRRPALHLLPARIRALESIDFLSGELRQFAWYVALTGCDTQSVLGDIIVGQIKNVRKAPTIWVYNNCHAFNYVLTIGEFESDEIMRAPVSYKEFARRFPGSDWFGQVWLLKDVIMSGLIDE